MRTLPITCLLILVGLVATANMISAHTQDTRIELITDCYSFGIFPENPKAPNRISDPGCLGNEKMYAQARLAPGITHVNAGANTAPIPPCVSGFPTGQDPYGPVTKAHPGSTCVTPRVPLPPGGANAITRIQLSVTVNNRSPAACGPASPPAAPLTVGAAFVVKDGVVTNDTQADHLYQCGAMFGKDIDVQFGFGAFAAPTTTSDGVSAVFFNWDEGPTKTAMIRVYYK